MKRWMRAIIVFIVLGLIFLLLKGINFSEVLLLLKFADPFWMFLAVCATFLTFIIWTFRWTYFFGGIFKGEFKFMLSVLFAGAFFNTITPGAGVGGEPFRAHYLATRYKQPHTKMLAYVLGDKFFQLMTLTIFGIFSIFFLLISVEVSFTLMIILSIILAIILFLAILVIYLIVKNVNLNFGRFFKKIHVFKFIKSKFATQDHLERYINKRINSFLKIFRKLIKSKKNLAIGFSLSFVYWILVCLTSYLIFVAFNHPMNFFLVIVVVILGTLIGDLSLIPSGVGITELAMTLLFSAVGVFPPLAFLVALFSRLIYYLFSLVVGGFSLLHVRKVVDEVSTKK